MKTVLTLKSPLSGDPLAHLGYENNLPAMILITDIGEEKKYTSKEYLFPIAKDIAENNFPSGNPEREKIKKEWQEAVFVHFNNS